MYLLCYLSPHLFLEPKLITQLKAEVQRLKDEVAMVTGKKYTGELSDEEMDRYLN